MNTLLLWGKGLIAAFIGGASSSVSAVVAAPDVFDLSSAGLKKIGIVAGVSGVVSAATYLKQSPLPVASNDALVFAQSLKGMSHEERAAAIDSKVAEVGKNAPVSN